MHKSLAGISVLALGASAALLPDFDGIIKKCNSNCGDVGKIIHDNCTSLSGGCLEEVCKTANVRPCFECLKSENMFDTFESVCSVFGHDVNTSSSVSSSSASGSSASATSSSNASAAKQDDSAALGLKTSVAGAAVVAAAAVAACL